MKTKKARRSIVLPQSAGHQKQVTAKGKRASRSVAVGRSKSQGKGRAAKSSRARRSHDPSGSKESPKQARRSESTAWESATERGNLRKAILASLEEQGFQLEDGRIVHKTLTKDALRSLHQRAVAHKIELARPHLASKEPSLIKRIASGTEVDPSRIMPRLIEIEPGTHDELLFRYAKLHWSIPVSSGYGRRLRFLVVDDFNDKLIGVIGLCDPVINLGPRDKWIGWDRATRHARLSNVLDAFVLGAVPPYSFLLCGKLVALMLGAVEVRHAFRQKYRSSITRIQQIPTDGTLALITSTSALGRSSVYNRLTFEKDLLWRSVGFTQGYGEFHFTNGVYRRLLEFAHASCEPTYRQAAWGSGFRNRKEILKKALPLLGLSPSLQRHGVEREVFVVPLAKNAREFLQGNATELDGFSWTAADASAYFKDRWLTRRASTDSRFRGWNRQDWILWPSTARN